MSDEVGKAIKDARIAAMVAAFCLCLMGVMLMIDGQRNKVMLEHVREARRILDEFRIGVSRAVHDAARDEPAAGSSVVGGSADHGGGDDGEPGPDLEPAPPGGAGEPDAGVASEVAVNGSRGRRAGMAGGPRGDG